MDRARSEEEKTAGPDPRGRDGATTGSGRSDPIAALHREVGNQALQSAFGGEQTETGAAGGTSPGIFRSVTAAAGNTVYRRPADGTTAGDQGEGRTVDERVESAVGARTSAYSVAASATVPEGVVHGDDEMTVSAVGETTVRASVRGTPCGSPATRGWSSNPP